MYIRGLLIILLQKKMLGQLVFDQVLRKLDLLERDFFGLRYEDDHKMMVKYAYAQ